MEVAPVHMSISHSKSATTFCMTPTKCCVASQVLARPDHTGVVRFAFRPIVWYGARFYVPHTHTHTHPFNGPFSGTTRVSQYQKGKPIWILLKQETVSGSGSGISWAVCKSAPCSRQITTPAPHHSGARFTKYLTTILRLSYDNAKVTID